MPRLLSSTRFVACAVVVATSAAASAAVPTASAPAEDPPAADTPVDPATPGSFTVVMQGSSEPGEAGEVVVFVGEQLDYVPKKIDCGEDCWVFDTWHTARYRVAEWIHGTPPGSELTFDVAEHAVSVPFGHSRYALVFVERFGDAWTLVKYEQMPVYPTADGSFASCGPLGDDAERRDWDRGFRGYPPLEDIAFSPSLVVDDARRLSPHGWGELHDPRWHARSGEEIVCRRGVPVDRIARFMANDSAVLKAALPALAGER